MALVFSCGIPTSVPILPKELEVRASPSLAVPLGGVKYNLYSGLHGGRLRGGIGSLGDIQGDSWLQDFLADLPGVAVYDYRPPGAGDAQQFLVHYKLDMKDTLGSSGEFDLSEYRGMIDDLTNITMDIDNVAFDFPSIDTKPIEVNIALNEVSAQIGKNMNLTSYLAWLPDKAGKMKFPYDIIKLGIEGNQGQEFSITLQGMESLTLKEGRLKFQFALEEDPKFPLGEGAKLTLSNFALRPDEQSGPISGVQGRGDTVELTSGKSTGETFVDFKEAKLPGKFDLACDLEITGSGHGFFKLWVSPVFESYTISGVEELVLSDEQLASLASTVKQSQEFSRDLGPSFEATVGEGDLKIDTKELFPPLDGAKPGDEPGDEGWNLKLDFSKLFIKQDVSDDGIAGLSLGGSERPLQSGANALDGKTLNSRPVNITGEVRAEIADGTNKLTFQNFPGGIKKDAGVSYEKKVAVQLDVSLYSMVKVAAEYFVGGVDALNQTKDLELTGTDFTAFKPWLNYIKFPANTEADPPDYGLGVVLNIEKLVIAEGLALYVSADKLGLKEVSQPLKNTGDQESAVLYFMNAGGHTITGEELPSEGESLAITVKVGMADATAQEEYLDTGILTIRNLKPDKSVVLEGMKANLSFDWAEMSITPQEHTNEGEDDPLPVYPFAGIFPDQEAGEEGMDLSDMSKGFGFYIPGKTPDGQAEEAAGGETLDARLYIALKRQTLNDAGEWVDDAGGDPDDPGGWHKNLMVSLPDLDFKIKYGDDSLSKNLFTYNPAEQKATGEWTLSTPLDLKGLVEPDAENGDNPFKLYTASSLPEEEKGIPIGNLAAALNESLLGRKEGPLFFEYTVKLASVPGSESGAMLLYPDMLNKRVAASADLLVILPLVFQADPDAEGPVSITIDPDMGDADLFQRSGRDDDGFFDLVVSFGFDIAINDMAGLSVGRLYLRNKTGVPGQEYELPLLDFSKPRNRLFLDSGELKKLKAIYPFIPQAAVEFDPGQVARIGRSFAIGLQSVAINAGGEYTFTTGL
jgi:hypothetical protein